jgi:hypothetical protein
MGTLTGEPCNGDGGQFTKVRHSFGFRDRLLDTISEKKMRTLTPLPYPQPTQVFHITAIDNLKLIAQQGAIYSKNLVAELGIAAVDIAYEEVQDRRANKAIQMGPAGELKDDVGPGGTLHDYMPFYFAPRSPMLGAINKGRVPGCDYRQDDIAHLVSNAQAIGDAGHQFVFTDFHALKAYASFFDDLAHLDVIDWPLFFERPSIEGYCMFWNSNPKPPHYARRQQTRMAEFLVYKKLPIAAISEVGIRTAAGEARIRAALEGTGWNPTVRTLPGWYF